MSIKQAHIKFPLNSHPNYLLYSSLSFIFHHVVYKIPVEAEGDAEIFAGVFLKPDKGNKHLNSPSGIAVDSKENVFVSDTGNNRICAFSSDSTFRGHVQVDMPGYLGCDSAKNKIYVITKGKTKKLLRFPGLSGKNIWKPGAPEASLDVPGNAGVLCVDMKADPVTVWVASGRTVLKIIDRGTAFEMKGPVVGVPKKKGLVGTSRWLGVDTKREELYVGNQRFNGITGAYIGPVPSYR